MFEVCIHRKNIKQRICPLMEISGSFVKGCVRWACSSPDFSLLTAEPTSLIKLGPGKPNDAGLRTCVSDAGSHFVASLQLLAGVLYLRGGKNFALHVCLSL